MSPSYKVIPGKRYKIDGPVKGWKSVKFADVYHYDVEQIVRRFLFCHQTIEVQRVVCVHIEFTNGMKYSSHGLFRGEDKDISIQAIYKALKEYSHCGILQSAA